MTQTPQIVIGAVMARNLKVGIGDEITLLGSGRTVLCSRRAHGLEFLNPDHRKWIAVSPRFRWAISRKMFAMGDHGNSIAVCRRQPGSCGP